METMAQKPIGAPTYSASQVADYFVFLSNQMMIDEGVSEGVTPLKLQKFLYFAQAASLAMFDKKLFGENIEAWKYGPVVSEIYHHYKNTQGTSDTPITVTTGVYKEISDDQTKQLITGVWELFDKYSARELVDITHQHSPWKNLYQEGKNVVIPPEVLRDYYRDIFQFESDGQE